MKNPKNNSHYLAITIRSGKAIINPPIIIFDEAMNDVDDVDVALETKPKKLMTTSESS